jgi:hypothetical protein
MRWRSAPEGKGQGSLAPISLRQTYAPKYAPIEKVFRGVTEVWVGGQAVGVLWHNVLWDTVQVLCPGLGFFGVPFHVPSLAQRLVGFR